MTGQCIEKARRAIGLNIEVAEVHVAMQHAMGQRRCVTVHLGPRINHPVAITEPE